MDDTLGLELGRADEGLGGRDRVGPGEDQGGVGAVLSAFMNNVGAVAMLMPAVVGISRQTKVPVSRLLIPLAFASLLGGKMTLIGTPANILASGILTEVGLNSFGFFEFAPMGAVVLATGIIYMVFIGKRLLPVPYGR